MCMYIRSLVKRVGPVYDAFKTAKRKTPGPPQPGVYYPALPGDTAGC